MENFEYKAMLAARELNKENHTILFKVITNYCRHDPKPYKLGYYNREGKWFLEKEFANEKPALEAARALNAVEPSARCLLEMEKPKRAQFY